MEVIQLSHALGAEIRGVDITGDLNQAEIGAIRETWHDAHVLVFRGVDWTPDRHLAFSKRFGALDKPLNTVGGPARPQRDQHAGLERGSECAPNSDADRPPHRHRPRRDDHHAQPHARPLRESERCAVFGHATPTNTQ